MRLFDPRRAKPSTAQFMRPRSSRVLGLNPRPAPAVQLPGSWCVSSPGGRLCATEYLLRDLPGLLRPMMPPSLLRMLADPRKAW